MPSRNKYINGPYINSVGIFSSPAHINNPCIIISWCIAFTHSNQLHIGGRNYTWLYMDYPVHEYVHPFVLSQLLSLWSLTCCINDQYRSMPINARSNLWHWSNMWYLLISIGVNATKLIRHWLVLIGIDHWSSMSCYFKQCAVHSEIKILV